MKLPPKADPPWAGMKLRSYKLEIHFPRLCAFAGADGSPFLEEVHEARGSRVADLQSPLEQGRRGLFRLAHDFQGLFVKIVVVSLVIILEGNLEDGPSPIQPLVLVPDVRLRSRLEALVVVLDKFNYFLHFILGDIGALEALGLREFGGNEEQVAFSQELFRACGVQNRARVDL